MREAVALDPAIGSYWNSLGMVLGAAGDLAEAEKAFAEALAREPGNAQYAYNRGLALMRQGRADDATAAFRRALTLQPRFAAARQRLSELGRASVLTASAAFGDAPAAGVRLTPKASVQVGASARAPPCKTTAGIRRLAPVW